MKRLTLFIILISIFTFSCEKDKYERNLESVAGTWQLSNLVYQNSSGEFKEISNSETKLIFTNKRDPANQYESRLGIQLVGKDSLDFKYSFDFSSGECDLMFKRTDQEKMPVDAIGRVQVYSFRFIDKNTLEFSIGKEFDYSNNQVVENAKYTFKRI